MKSAEGGDIVIEELEELSRNYKPRAKIWSDEEAKILLKYKGKMADKDLAKFLGRSLSSIRKKHDSLRVEQ